jgi:hypothetical protein
LIHSVDDQLGLLALERQSNRDPFPLASAAEAERIGELLCRSYDIVLVDLGVFFDPRSQPIALELIRILGITALLVVAAEETIDPRDLATVTEHACGGSCELLGIIANQFAPPRATGITCAP